MSTDLTASLKSAVLARTDDLSGSARPCGIPGSAGACSRPAYGPSRFEGQADAQVAESRTLTRDRTMSRHVARALVDAIAQHGAIPRDRILRAARLAPEQLEAGDGRIACATVCRLCELALDLTGDATFALRWAFAAERSDFSPLTELIVNAATLRQGLATLSHFFRLLSDEASFQLLEQNDEAVIRCMPLPGASLRVQRFAAEVMVPRLWRIVRCFSADAEPLRLDFAYAAPSHQAAYTRFFERAVRFERPHTELAFARALLDRTSARSDAEVYQALRQIAERRLHARAADAPPYALRVRELLIQRGRRSGTDMEAVARALGLSVRSLRRRLAAEGRGYDELVNDALAVEAKQLLAEPERSIQEIGHALGFCNGSAFHRAFKRWTGMTPSAYRKTQPPVLRAREAR